MASIRIERLPKLDKVLRVTFSAIRADVNELREDFHVLEDKVSSSLDVFKERQKNNHISLTKNTKEGLNSLEKTIATVNKEFNSELNLLAKSVDKFIDKTEQKTSSWNKKIRTLEVDAIRTKEMGQELKEVKRLTTELDKIKIFKKEMEDFRELVIFKKRYEQDFKQLKKDQEKIKNKNNIDINFLTSNLEKKFFSQSEKFSKIFSGFDEKLKTSVKFADFNSMREEISELKKKMELDKKKKEKEVNFKEFIELKNSVSEFKKSYNLIVKENSILKNKIESLEKDCKLIKTLEKKMETQGDSAEVKEFKKTIESLTKEVKSVESKINLNTGLKKEPKIEKIIFKEVKEPLPKKKSVKVLKKEIESEDSKIEKEKNKKNKEKKEKEKKEEEKGNSGKNELKEKKGGMFKRFLDFLIEDVEEEKDMKIQEFDKKKGEKFEIKEIKNLEP